MASCLTNSAHAGCGCNHARLAPLASDGLDDDVADGVHHDRSLPTLLDTGHWHVSEGVHHDLAPLDTAHWTFPLDTALVVFLVHTFCTPFSICLAF